MKEKQNIVSESSCDLVTYSHFGLPCMTQHFVMGIGLASKEEKDTGNIPDNRHTQLGKGKELGKFIAFLLHITKVTDISHTVFYTGECKTHFF